MTATTTKAPYTNRSHPPTPHTHAWARVKPVCEAVYTASLCVTTITHHTPTRHKPSNHAVFRVSHIITIHHITQMRTPHKHPTYAPTNIDPTYTNQNTPHEYSTRNTLIFHPHMRQYSTHMCTTNTHTHTWVRVKPDKRIGVCRFADIKKMSETISNIFKSQSIANV